MSVKLSSQLPKDFDRDGLSTLNSDLIENPKEIRVCIAFIDCSQTVTDTYSGVVEPTARIVRIEPVYGTDKKVAQEMLLGALQFRTGMDTLALDFETSKIFIEKTAE